MKLNHYRMLQAFSERDEAEIVRILADEFGDTAIERMHVVSFIYSGRYVECFTRDSVYEWYPDDGFTSRGRHPYDAPDHILIGFSES